jgi:ABC-type glycerol-3-phosphate transport system permease component
MVATTPTATAATRQSAWVHPRRRRRWGTLLLRALSHLVLILLVLFAILPLAWAISTAFKPNSEVMTNISIIPTRPTLSHFRFVLENTEFPRWLRNSLQVSLATVALSLVIGGLAGYAMSRWRFRGRGIYGTTLLIVQMFPGVMLGLPLYLVLTDYGLINTLWALLVTYLTFALAFSVWMLKGYFDSIPRDIEEAALIDGANRLQVLYQIILRLAAPGIATVAIYTFLLSWTEFLFAYLFIVDKDKQTLILGMYTFLTQYTTQWGDIMAAGVLATLPALFFFFVLQRVLTRGLIAGAMKG